MKLGQASSFHSDHGQVGNVAFQASVGHGLKIASINGFTCIKIIC